MKGVVCPVLVNPLAALTVIGAPKVTPPGAVVDKAEQVCEFELREIASKTAEKNERVKILLMIIGLVISDKFVWPQRKNWWMDFSLDITDISARKYKAYGNSITKGRELLQTYGPFLT